MPGFVVERNGFTTAAALARAVITDMTANGFVMKYPAPPFNPTNDDPFRVTMEAGPNVDPLSTTQPWRVTFDLLADQRLMIYTATPTQLTDDGKVATELGVDASSAVDILGCIGAQLGTTGLTVEGVYSPALDDPTKGFINRVTRVGNKGPSYPLSYRLVITPRGFWLGTWEEAVSTESASNFNWVLIQRPVDRVTGTVLTSGKAPVFCVNAIGGKYWQFTVRESDITRPGKRRPADSNTNDSEQVLNTKNQVSLSEDGKYIVTFPSRLNTSRYRYPHELDIIGITSADVVSQYSDVPLRFYGEPSDRVYMALHANGGNNIGMRILILKTGGGI